MVRSRGGRRQTGTTPTPPGPCRGAGEAASAVGLRPDSSHLPEGLHEGDQPHCASIVRDIGLLTMPMTGHGPAWRSVVCSKTRAVKESRASV